MAERCDVTYESPQGRGFGAAALQMRTSFKLQPIMGPKGPIRASVKIGVPFRAPDTHDEINSASQGSSLKSENMPTIVNLRGSPLVMTAVTMVNRPIWVAAPSYSDWTKAYPAQAGQAEGYVAAHCRVLRRLKQELGGMLD